MKGKPWAVSLDSINTIFLILWMKILRSREVKCLCPRLQLVNDKLNEDLISSIS